MLARVLIKDGSTQALQQLTYSGACLTSGVQSKFKFDKSRPIYSTLLTCKATDSACCLFSKVRQSLLIICLRMRVQIDVRLIQPLVCCCVVTCCTLLYKGSLHKRLLIHIIIILANDEYWSL